MIKIALLGSTGSIGTQVLNVVNRYPNVKSIHQNINLKKNNVILELNNILENSSHMIKYVEHNNIILRKANMEDLEKLYYNLWSSEEVAKYLFWKKTDNLIDAEERIKRTVNFQMHHHSFVVALKTNNEKYLDELLDEYLNDLMHSYTT